MPANPFTPSFGVSPPLLIGRAQLLADLSDALDEGPGAPARATLYTGPRGTGKTVMLNEAGEIASGRGWIVLHETADAGLLDRLSNEHLPEILRNLTPPAPRARLRGVTGFGVGATWDTEPPPGSVPGLRAQLTRAADLLATQRTGLMITVDEINKTHVEELRRLAATVQHLFREERELMFVGAGLPSAVSAVLNEDVLTFLQRADQHVLGPVALHEVVAALVETIETNGRRISEVAATRAADATAGYPYLIQLVGYQIWRQHASAPEVSGDDVTAGILQAERRLGKVVFEPTLKGLSEVDRTFLVAMACDDGPSSTADVAARMGVERKYASVYRARLIEGGVIEPASRYGFVRFTTPALRDYLRDHVAYHAQQGTRAPRRRPGRPT